MIKQFYTYWKRGHGIYIATVLSMLNFMVIQYRLLIEQIPVLNAIIPSLTVFILLFIFVVVPITIIIGRFDFKKGLYSTEVKVAFDHNPRLTEMIGRIRNIEDMIKEAKEHEDKGRTG